MTSLRARITALLIAAILTVVGLATLAASRALRPPSPETTIEPVALQVHLLARLAETAPEALRGAGGTVQDEPAEGVVIERTSLFLASALRRTGPARLVIVSRIAPDRPLLASVALNEGWLVTPVPDPAPAEDQWRSLALWLGMIVAGSAVVSAYAARRLSRPLELLEDAAGRIGEDATLSPVAETGPAEVRATARALNRLSGRLAQAIESRMRLVAAAGHDLRTPMTRMRLRAEFIPDEAERARWLADLAELDRIADSAISLVREETSAAAAEPVRLDRLLPEIAAELTETGHDVRIEAALPSAIVHAPPVALKRALRNLVLNAATHGGGARLSLTRGAGKATVTILDEGPGIPPELLDQVFEPFFRADPARSQAIPGAGLGMASAAGIISRLGGRITVANATPRGLLQQVILPLTQPDG